MKSKWLFFFNVVVVCAFIGIGTVFLCDKAKIDIKGNMEPILEKNVVALVNEIAKIDALKGKKVEFRIANFGQNDNVVEPDRDNYDLNIIWLGSRKKLYLNYLDLYDYVFASSQMLVEFLRANKIKAYYLPLGDFGEIKKIKNDDEKFYGIIGFLPQIEELIQFDGLKYKKYDLKNIEKIEKDIPKLKAVFAINTEFAEDSLDLHPIFFKLARHNVALASLWQWPDKIENINLFNDSISFWMNEEGRDLSNIKILIDEIKRDDEVIKKRKIKAKHLIEKEFSQDVNVKRFVRAIKDNKEYKDKESVYKFNMDLGVAVGHIGSGDFWLARDLLNNIATDDGVSSISYFNSSHKYSADVNILIRGFFNFWDRDFLGKKNILYVAYPQFSEINNVEEVLNLKEYAKKVDEIKDKFDAIAVASLDLSEELKKNGVNAYYVPQFTNTDRFYEDVDEDLKSDVLFVGVNTFYRKAVHWLLEENIKVDVYGPAYPDGVAKKFYLDNRVLRKYYSSSKIVLNDTRDGMRQLGFISNRIFDASACGSLVVSDYMKEIEDIYGDSVILYKNKEELIEKVKYYLDPKNENERKEKAKKAQEITLKHFTAKIAGQKFRKIIDEIEAKNDEK